jgi:hypothetical protein
MSVDIITEVKNPGGIANLGVDFTNGLDGGDSLGTPVVDVFETATLEDTTSTMLVPASTTKVGNIVSALIQAGDNGKQYSVRFAAPTTNGEKMYHIRKLKVKDERN